MPASAAAKVASAMESEGSNLIIELIKMSSEHAATLKTINETLKELKDTNMVQHGQVTERIAKIETRQEVSIDRVQRLQETVTKIVADQRELEKQIDKELHEERQLREKNTLTIARAYGVVAGVLAIGQTISIIGPLLGWF